MEEGPRSKAVRLRGLQYCQYSQKKISLITLLSDHVPSHYISSLLNALRYFQLTFYYRDDRTQTGNFHGHKFSASPIVNTSTRFLLSHRHSSSPMILNSSYLTDNSLHKPLQYCDSFIKHMMMVFGPKRDWLRAGRSGDRIPVGARFFAHLQTGPGAHLDSCTKGTGSFQGSKRPRRGADNPPPPNAEIENEYSYTTTPRLGPGWPVIVWPWPLLYYYHRVSTQLQLKISKIINKNTNKSRTQFNECHSALLRVSSPYEPSPPGN
jgi:hypothetical protein